MSQDEIIEAMRRLGGKNLFSKDIEKEFVKIHFDDRVYKDLRLGRHSTHTSFSYGLRRLTNNGTVTRCLANTNTVSYRTLRKFVYSLTLQDT